MPIDYRWEPPSLRERKKSYWWAYLIGIILVLWIVLYVLYLLTPVPVPAVQKQETVQQPVQAPVQEEKAVFKSDVPPFDSKCTVTAGIVSGSIKIVDNIASFTFKNSGKIEIKGSYFEASNFEKKAYRKNMESVAPGSEITYTVDLDDVSLEVGIQVKSFVILPIQNDNACFNQRMIVIK